MPVALFLTFNYCKLSGLKWRMLAARYILVCLLFPFTLTLVNAQNTYTWVRSLSSSIYTYPKEEFPGYKFSLDGVNDGKGNFHVFSSFYFDGYTSLNLAGSSWKNVLDTNCNETGRKEDVTILNLPGILLPYSAKINYRGDMLTNLMGFSTSFSTRTHTNALVVKRKDGSNRFRYSLSVTSSSPGPSHSAHLGPPAFDSAHATYFHEYNTLTVTNALTKLDESGNLKWRRHLSMNAGIRSIIHCRESNILYMSITSTGDTAIYDSVRMIKRGKQQLIVKLDTSGHVISWKPTLSAVSFLSNADGLIWCSVEILPNDTMKFDTLSSFFTNGRNRPSIYALMDTATNWKLAFMIQYAKVNGNGLGGIYIGNNNKLYIDLAKSNGTNKIIIGTDTLASNKYFVSVLPNGLRTYRSYAVKNTNGGDGNYKAAGMWVNSKEEFFIAGVPSGDDLIFCSYKATDRQLFIAKFGDTANITAPGILTSNIRTTSKAPSSLTLNWRKGGGAERLIVASETIPVSASPQNGQAYLADPVFGSGSQLGLGNFVVYKGNDTTVTITGLKAGTPYHFTIIEYEGCTPNHVYSLSALYVDTTTARHYYTKASGQASDLLTWGANPDGSGRSPVSFLTDSVVFHFTNNPLAVFSRSVSFAGKGTKLEIGDSLTPQTVVIPTLLVLTASDIVLHKFAKLEVKGELSCNSIYAFDSTLIICDSARLVDCRNSFSCFDLEIYTPLATPLNFKGTTTKVRNRLLLDGNVSGSMQLGTKATDKGELDYRKGFISGVLSRWIKPVLTTGTDGLFPLGDLGFDNKTLSLNYTIPPSAGGIVEVRPFSFNSTRGLPLTDTTGGVSVKINQKGQGGWMISTFTTPSAITGGKLSIRVTDQGAVPRAVNMNRLLKADLSGNLTLVGDFAGNAGSPAIPEIAAFNCSLPSGTSLFTYGFDNSAPVLPVTWLSFTGQTAGQHALLNWKTASESNNSHFEIERSVDGLHFTYVGREEGNANTSSISNYGFTDRDAFSLTRAKVLYYRLRQVDYNEHHEYSRTIAISSSGQPTGHMELSTFPNPFTEKLNLTLSNVSEGTVSIEVYDLNGHKHYTQTTLSDGQGTLSIDLSSLADLAKGVYILSIRKGDASIQQKLMKGQ